MPSNKQRNPLNVLVGIAGVAFGITACAYGLLMVMELRDPGLARAPQQGFFSIMDQYGGWLLTGELVVLALSSMAAIGLDSIRQKRASANPQPTAPGAELKPETEPKTVTTADRSF